MKRFPHYLGPNVKSRRPTSLIFLDCDSTSESLADGDEREMFKSAAVAAARRRKTMYVVQPPHSGIATPEEAWDIIMSQTREHSRTLVVCPTPVRVLTLLRHTEYLIERGWKLEDPVSSKRFTAIAWRNDTRTLLFIAHGNLFPMQPLLDRYDRERVDRMCRTWIEYLKLLDELDVGDFHMSLGAQALGIYRHRFMQHAILIHANPDVDEIEQRACLGALYQPFFFGKCPPDTYYYLDTNAMYPTMMKRFQYPWRLVGHLGICHPALLTAKLSHYAVIATVRLKSDEPRYPVRLDNRTIFPVGEFTTTLTTPDLWHAVAHGHVRDVYAIAWYDACDLFSRFVNFWWAKRREFNENGRPLWAQWSKAIMVALYGRFGAHEFETRVDGDNPFDCDRAGEIMSADNGEAAWYSTLAGKMYSSSRVGLNYNSFPAIMAHVSAYARNQMFQLIARAGADNMFIAVSDGLIVNQAGFEKLRYEIMPDELGALKLKLTGDELEILSDTEFRLGVKTWRPGVKRDATEINDGVFVEHLDPNLATLSRKDIVNEYVKRRITISLTRQIRTGRVEASGRIVPLRLSQPPPLQAPAPR